MLTDESMLSLLSAIRIDHAGSVESLRAHYAAVAAAGPGQPSFEDLLEEGWFEIVMGRICTPMDVGVAGLRKSATHPALADLLRERYRLGIDINQVPSGDAAIFDIAQKLAAGTIDGRHFSCRTPAWVAARLWERRVGLGGIDAMLWWLDRWEMLGSPPLAPCQIWSGADAASFRETALQIIKDETALCGWNDIRHEIAHQTALPYGRVASDAIASIPEPPHTLVGRSEWLDRQPIEHAMMGRIEAYSSILQLITFLFADVEVQAHSPAPHPIVAQLVELGSAKPDLLAMLVRRVRARPVLLADILLDPASSGVACSLIAGFTILQAGLDRQLEENDDERLKGVAFEGALAIFVDTVAGERCSPAEAADLLVGQYDRHRTSRLRATIESAASTTLRALAELPQTTCLAIVDSITKLAGLVGPDSPPFLAGLDLIAAAGLEGILENSIFVTAFIKGIERGDYGLSADRLSTSAAVALVTIAQSGRSDLFASLVEPIDVRGRLTAQGPEQEYEERDRLARSIRCIVRVLSQGVAGLGEDAPDMLIDGLARAIRSGARDDESDGKIEAFGPAHMQFLRDKSRPIAADLGQALRSQHGNRRDQLLGAMVTITEPVVLAELLSYAPHDTHAAIRAAVLALTPQSAGAITSLNGALTRVDALLNAGLADAAAAFMADEEGQSTLGKVPGRERIELTNRLRLNLLRGEWDAIENAEVPPNLLQIERQELTDLLAFYKAVASLQNPKIPPILAEQRFETLSKRQPYNAAYALNYFAARIRVLLGNDSFTVFSSGERRAGIRALTDVEQAKMRLGALSPADAEKFEVNTAILLLAIGQPDQAATRLFALGAGTLNPTRSAFLAIALARTGRQEMASSTLDQAETLFGTVDLLDAARAHIEQGRPFLGRPLFAADDGTVDRLKAAISELRLADALLQTRILGTGTYPFRDYVLRQVRAAATSVMTLVPMMEAVRIKEGEDDITALLKELLRSRLAMLGWSVPDQSKGGYTAAGNPGERDLLLQQDTTTLVTVEAVVANGSIPHAVLTEHFQKLLGYADCQLYFHVTYAWLDGLAHLIASLKRTAQAETPPGYRFVRLDDLPVLGDQTPGFLATYQVADRQIEVVFLALDLGQVRLQQAAKTAKLPKPRRSKAPKKAGDA